MSGYLALTDWQLEEMRQTQQAHHPETVKVERLVRTPDGKGGWTTGTPTLIYQDAPCTITPGVELRISGQADRGLEVENWMVTFPWGYDIQDEDVLTYGEDEIQLQVLNAKWDKSNGTALRCTAQRVEGNPW